MSATGYVYHELFMWHDAGPLQHVGQFIQPTKHWEHPETKRRLHNLLAVSGLLERLKPIVPRKATTQELTRVHTPEYISRVQNETADFQKGHSCFGDEATLSPGGFDIAALAAGGCITAVEAVLAGKIRNAYCLVRPPGHHACKDQGMGFCIFNNVAVAARHAMEVHGLQRIAVVDYDVHHGNGTQSMFEDDPRLLFISLHQDRNYPHDTGQPNESGIGAGEGFNLNVSLPPGCGQGAYRAAFERVVVPAVDAFKPELILVSSGFDGAYLDPLARMMLSSEDFRWMIRQLMSQAAQHCNHRLVAMHEGGYSELYVPFCGLAVLEELSGLSSGVTDPFLGEVSSWGYQGLQPHQDAAIRAAEEGLDMLLRGISRLA